MAPTQPPSPALLLGTDLTLAREKLGYVPIESFDDGLERTLDALAPRRNSA